MLHSGLGTGFWTFFQFFRLWVKWWGPSQWASLCHLTVMWTETSNIAFLSTRARTHARTHTHIYIYIWNRVVPEDLTVSQPVKTFLHFMEPEVLLLHSQAPDACPCSESDRSSLCLPILLLDDLFGFVLSSTPRWSFSFRCSTKTLYAPVPVPATWPAHLFILVVITRIMFVKGYKLKCSSCSLLHCPFTYSLLGPNIVFSTLLSETLNLTPPSIWEAWTSVYLTVTSQTFRFPF